MTDANWHIFHRGDENGTPTEFAEILLLGDSVIRRQGKVNTFGESEKLSFPDADGAFRAIGTGRAQFEEDGFALVRSWEFRPQRFDYDLLQKELEAAIETTVRRLRAEHPGLNAFALATDGSFMTVGPIAHEFESLDDADDAELWIPDEWNIWEGGPYFDVAYRLILSQHRDDVSEVDFETFAVGFRDTSVAALEAVDAKGLFGPRNDRVLHFHVTDSDQDEDAMRRLNSPELFARWKDWA